MSWQAVITLGDCCGAGDFPAGLTMVQRTLVCCVPQLKSLAVLKFGNRLARPEADVMKAPLNVRDPSGGEG